MNKVFQKSQIRMALTCTLFASALLVASSCTTDNHPSTGGSAEDNGSYGGDYGCNTQTNEDPGCGAVGNGD